MSVDVGGINVNIGANTEKFEKAVDRIQKDIAKFSEDNRAIQIKAFVRTSALKELPNQFKLIEKGITSLERAYAGSIEKMEGAQDRWSARAKKKLAEVQRTWDSFNKEIPRLAGGATNRSDALQNLGFGLGDGGKKLLSAAKSMEKLAEAKSKYFSVKKEKANLETLLAEIDKLPEGFKKAQAANIEFLKNLTNKNLTVQSKDLLMVLKEMGATVVEYNHSVLKGEKQKQAEYKNNLNVLKQTYAQITRIQRRGQMAAAGSEEEAYRKRAEEAHKLRVEITELNTQRKIGYDANTKLKQINDRLNKLIASGVKLTREEISLRDQYFNRVLKEERQTVKLAEAKKAEARAEKERAKAAKQAQETIDLESGAKSAKERAEALKKNANLQTVLRQHILAGYKVEENELKLLKAINDQRRMGGHLTGSQQELRSSIKYKQRKTELGDFNKAQEKELKLASSINEAKKRLAKTTHALDIQIAKLRADIEVGNKSDKQRLQLLDLLQKKQKSGSSINKQEQKELKELLNLKKKIKAEESTSAADNFFSPKNLGGRLKWFLQLRASWAVYRGVSDTLLDMVEYHTQLSRALRTARSEFQSLEEITRNYSETMQAVVAQHGVSWEQVGEALYQLGSAGLSAEESMAAVNSTMSLIVGTEGDAAETTKAVAGIYNNFADAMGDVYTMEEKFVRINQVLANTWQNHQNEMSELVDAFKYVAPVAKISGLALEDVSAILGVMHDNMVKGGRAGRSLVNIIQKISRSPMAFQQAFGLQDLDLTGPLNLITVMDKLSTKLNKSEISILELQTVFERFGLRASAPLITLVQNWDDVQESIKDYKDGLVSLEEIENRRLNNLASQFDLLKGKLKDLYTGDVKHILDTLRDIIKWSNTKLSPIAERGAAMKDVINTNYDLKDSIEELNKTSNNQIEDEEQLNKLIALGNNLQEKRQNLIAIRNRQKEEGTLGWRDPHTIEEYLKVSEQTLNNLDEILKKADKTNKQILGGKTSISFKVDTPQKVKEYFEADLQSLEINYKKALLAGEEAGGEAGQRYLKGLQDRADQLAETLEGALKQGLLPGASDTLKDEYRAALDAQLKFLEKIKKYEEDITKEKVKSHRLLIDELEVAKKILQNEKKQLERDGIQEKDKKRIFQITQEISKLDKKIVGQEKTITELQNFKSDSLVEQARQLAKVKKENIDIEALSQSEADLRKYITDATKDLNKQLEINNILRRTALQESEFYNRDKKARADLEINALEEQVALKSMQLNVINANLKEGKNKDKEREADVLRAEINAIESDIKIANEKKNRIGNILYDADVQRTEQLQNQLEVQRLSSEYDKNDLSLKQDYNQSVRDILKNYTQINGRQRSITEEGLNQYNILTALNKLSEDDLRLKRILYALSLKQGQESLVIEKKIFNLKRTADLTAVKNAEIALEQLDLTLKYKEAKLDERKAIGRSIEEQQRLEQEINQLYVQRLQLEENLKRAQDGFYDGYLRLKEQAQSVNQLISDTVVQFGSDFSTGLGTIISDATGGFQEQAQEVINLEAQIRDLQNEAKNLEVSSPEDAERLKEINGQVADLNSQIKDLENPLQQLGDVFKQFFKDIIDGIRQALNEWISMQIAMGIIKTATSLFTPSSSTANAVLPSTQFDVGRAQGGILPKMTSFQKFSSGGTTSAPLLALLGDNASGKELVIPSEHIRKDSSYGYTRDKNSQKEQSVTVINMIDQASIHEAMATESGGKVIINRIAAEKNKNNPILRR